MDRSVSNARIELKGDGITITKRASNTVKIDPVMALFDAVSVMIAHPDADRSVYEDLAMVVV